MMELRWVWLPGGKYGYMVEQEKVLQYRTKIEGAGVHLLPPYDWHEWKNVPTVEIPRDVQGT